MEALATELNTVLEAALEDAFEPPGSDDLADVLTTETNIQLDIEAVYGRTAPLGYGRTTETGY